MALNNTPELLSTQVNMNRSLRLLDRVSRNVSSPYRATGQGYTNLETSMNTTMDRDTTINLLNSRPFPTEMDATLDIDTTNVTQLLAEESSNLDGSEIYEQFNNLYQKNSRPNQVFELLSSYTSMLADKTEASKTILRNVTASKSRRASLMHLHNSLRSEMWTWQLSESLLKDLVNSESKLLDDEMMEADMSSDLAVTTDVQLMENFFRENDKVRRCQLVIDWLETMNAEDVLDTYYNKVDYFTDKASTMWENTLHMKLKSHSKNVGLVSEMDPDAPYRLGEKLSSLDQEDDERLARHVFALLRAGKLEEAQDLCVRCGQAWKAATLEGWRLSHDPNYGNGSGDEQLEPTGNQYRDIWKGACLALVQEEMFSAHERAVYASLCGNLDNLLPVCDSWTDALWAYLKVLVDVELEEHLRLHSSSSDRQIVELPASYWARPTNLAHVFKEIESSHRDNIRDQSQQFFHKIQKFLIQNEFEAIINLMLEIRRTPYVSPHLLRFMAHFILFLRCIDKVAVESSTAEIVEVYIHYLIQTKQYSLVASYCSMLPFDNQLIIYALFIEGIFDDELRQKVLEYGQQAGLDIPSITKIVASKALDNLKNVVDYNSHGNNKQLNTTPSSDVDKIISALDWLLYDQSQMMEALVQSTAQMRIFLAMKQYGRLKQVFSKLPEDCINKAMANKDNMQSSENNSIREYICFRAYIDAKQVFDDWFNHYHQSPKKPENPSGNNFADGVAFEQKMKQYKKDHQRWTNALQSITALACEKVKGVLLFAGGWMVDDIQDGALTDEDILRQEQLNMIRQLCIPEMTSLLYKILFETGSYKECVQIADLISSEDYKLYKAFPKSDLKLLLSNIREASIQLLDQNKSSLGYSLT